MRKGFTLIELLVAMAIMIVIMAAALVSYTGTRKTARDAKRKSDLESIRSALELYRSDNGGYPLPATWRTDIAPAYMESIPPDPLSTQMYAYGNPTPPICGIATCPRYVLCAGLELVPAGAPAIDANCSALTLNCGANCSYSVKNP